ncbi:MAG: hypothetical protein ABIQ64_04190 [Candidatus Saccharimonadales bacterium]
MMKYRDHSLNYVPRSTKRPAARPTEAPPHIETAAERQDDDPFLRRHSNDSEPLINVNDTESRIQRLKDGLGTLAHAGAHITATRIAPTAKKHAKNITVRVRSDAAHRVPRLTTRVKKIHSKSHVSIKKIIIVLAIFLTGYYAATHLGIPPKKIMQQTGGTSAQPVGGTSPAYNTLLPPDTSIEKLGGWQRVSPPDGNPVFAYIDTVDRIQITVSQQPLPDDFSSDPDKEVKDLALGFNASNRRVADDATVYFIGTSTKGPQSVILAKQKTLILIKSMAQIKDASWSRYIASLQ